MIKQVQTHFLHWSAFFFLMFLITGLNVKCGIAQSIESDEPEQLQPLHSGVDIYGLTGSLSWNSYYVRFPPPEGLSEQTRTELQVEFRRVYMLNAHIGIGYNVFSTVFMAGFFKGAGLGGVGAGPIVRYYPLEATRWQPYIQTSFEAGFNAALGSVSGITDAGGFRYRSGLRAGLDYKVSSSFGLFFEIGPSWEYDEQFKLDSRALQIDVGIELFRF